MAGKSSYDVLIIGSGQAGVPLAYGLAKAGKRVDSARIAHLARRATEFGLYISRVEVDFPAVLKRAKEILMKLREGLERGFENSENPDCNGEMRALKAVRGRPFMCVSAMK